MTKHWMILAAAGVLVLAGCERKAEAPRAAPAAPHAVAPYKMGMTTKDLMKYAIDPSADIVWASSGYVVDMKGTTDLSPKTPQAWTVVENNATIVAELSNALMLPERAPEEQPWNSYANRLYDTAMAAKKAAATHDKAGLLRTGSDMFLACTACHTRYVLGEK